MPKDLRELPKLKDSISYMNNEQGFSMEMHGTPYRKVVDINGLQFIAIEGGEESFDGTRGSGGFEESLVGENQSV